MQQVDDNLGDLRHELESFDANHEKKFIQVGAEFLVTPISFFRYLVVS